ncbi:acyl-CoA thioesterase domain-containing protein [Nocardia sp. NPDC057353]|uniref:acyl-CoA thioesterase domain-containing protein n=1 Tax=Nocardia sp. NPDC057353 TaxID=3346104 RepID=UPI00362BCE73
MPREHVVLRNYAAEDAPETVGGHVPYFCVLEAATRVWNRMLLDAFDENFTLTDIAVVNVNSDFARELFTGAAEVDVEVVKIGRTSVALRAGVEQGGVRAVDLTVTLVQLGADRSTAQPWSPDQIARLGTLRSSVVLPE